MPVVVRASSARRRTKAVVDTGSNDSIFPLQLAGVLGVLLGSAGTHRVVWHGQAFPLQFGTVDLELSDGSAGFRWSALVGFSPAPIPYALFGIRGCLQFFDATFCGKDLTIELTINSSFQGHVF